ncbi:MAG: hypothetical protein VST70_06950 [Nitrospirota bacterium]|nr:hypothetical protein [Nitrospirota bacterium]
MIKLLDCPLCGGEPAKIFCGMHKRGLCFKRISNDPDGSKWNQMVTYIRAGILREKHPEICFGVTPQGEWILWNFCSDIIMKSGTFQQVVNEAWDWVKEEEK